jgi:hypothetical protein
MGACLFAGRAALVLTLFVATHNGAARLPRLLDSYTRLQPPRGGWKLVVIDNDSADDSARVATSFADRLPLVCLSEPRRGKNRALNAGLRALEGDLAVFSDDDVVADANWLVELRGAAERLPEFAIFGGSLAPLWVTPPEGWIHEWLRLPAVFAITEPALDEGPCEPTRVFGPNMAVRAELFAKGHRFDERIGPNGTSTYAMGSETEFTLRMAIVEGAACWHCQAARVQVIIPPSMTTRTWVLKRAFRLGRCVYRESRQKAAAGWAHVPRGWREIGRGLAGAARDLTLGAIRRDAGRAFLGRWDLNLWTGCLAEAVRARSSRSQAS